MKPRSSLVLLVVWALAVGGCGAKSQGEGSGNQGSRAAVSASSTPQWLANDKALFEAREPDFSMAASATVASTDYQEEGFFDTWDWDQSHFYFHRLPARLSTLSAAGGVWAVQTDSGASEVYFNNGMPGDTCTDGLLYSTSATEAPEALTTPVPVAPHWWIAAWDPLMFSSFGPGRDKPGYWAKACAKDPAGLSGGRRVVSGTLEYIYHLNTGAWVGVVTGTGKPTPVVVNSLTHLHIPADWSATMTPRVLSTAERGSDVAMTALVAAADFPGLRSLDFALEATVTGR